MPISRQKVMQLSTKLHELLSFFDFSSCAVLFQLLAFVSRLAATQCNVNVALKSSPGWLQIEIFVRVSFFSPRQQRTTRKDWCPRVVVVIVVVCMIDKGLEKGGKHHRCCAASHNYCVCRLKSCGRVGVEVEGQKTVEARQIEETFWPRKRQKRSHRTFLSLRDCDYDRKEAKKGRNVGKLIGHESGK